MHLYGRLMLNRLVELSEINTEILFSQISSRKLEKIASLIIKFNARRTDVVLMMVLFALLQACATLPPEPLPLPPEPEPAPVVVEPVVCKPEINLKEIAALRKLALATEWHREQRYESAYEAYESILAEQASVLTDAHALWGIIALRLDRDNPGYSRDSAKTAMYVLENRFSDMSLRASVDDIDEALFGDDHADHVERERFAKQVEAQQQAKLLWFSAKIMVDADVSKDQVVIENKQLGEELVQREAALKRLKELTLGG